MLDPFDSTLTVDQRLQQLAAVLARGVRRYRSRLRRSEIHPDNETADSNRNCLEVVGNPRLSGSSRIGV